MNFKSVSFVLLGCFLALGSSHNSSVANAGPSCAKSSGHTAPPGYVSVVDYGATGSGVADDSAAIRCAIDDAATNTSHVWFPTGTYSVSGNIALPPGLTLAGEADGLTPAIVQASSPGTVVGDATYNSAKGASITLTDLAFDGVTVRFHGPSRSAKLQRDMFTDSKGLLNYAANGAPEVGLLDLQSATVTDSIFLHGGESTDAVPLQLYNSANVTVSNNIIGLDLDQSSWLLGWPGYARWTEGAGAATLSARLAGLRQVLALGRDQGQFRTGLYAERVTKVSVDGNVLNASPNTKGKRDHAAYFWGQGNGAFTRNWVRGWPAGGDGGIKVRNGSSITVGGNDLIGTGILTYVYDDFQPFSLDHVTVCDNRLEVAGATAGDTYAGIMYWQNTQPDSLSDILIYGNQFADGSHTTGINLGNGLLSAFAVYASNAYADTGVTVGLSASLGAPAPMPGSPDKTRVAQCTGLIAPSYSIPEYASAP